MLNIVVKIEEPAKEEQRKTNIEELFENKINMQNIENNILQLISNSKADDLLNDEKLINALQNSKKETDSIYFKIEKLSQD